MGFGSVSYISFLIQIQRIYHDQLSPMCSLSMDMNLLSLLNPFFFFSDCLSANVLKIELSTFTLLSLDI